MLVPPPSNNREAGQKGKATLTVYARSQRAQRHIVRVGDVAVDDPEAGGQGARLGQVAERFVRTDSRGSPASSLAARLTPSP